MLVSRYNTCERLRYGDSVYLSRSSVKEIPESDYDKFYTVTKETEGRLDLVAYKFYNNTKLYWVIALASGIDNPLDLPEGTVLRIPSLSTLYAYKGVVIYE